MVEVKDGVRQHFEEQFAAKKKSSSRLPSILSGAILNELDRSVLEERFTGEEIKRAVWDCGMDKCPSPDVFNFHFYCTHWEIVEVDIVAFVEEFYERSRLVKGLNSSFINLIPQKTNPQAIGDYRPISLIVECIRF